MPTNIFTLCSVIYRKLKRCRALLLPVLGLLLFSRTAPALIPTPDDIDLSGTWELTSNSQVKQTQIPYAGPAQGTIHLARQFIMPADSGKTCFFLADGIFPSCDVSLNGQFLFHHAAGLAPVTWEIPQKSIHWGRSNRIELVLQNRDHQLGEHLNRSSINRPMARTLIPGAVSIAVRSHLHMQIYQLETTLQNQSVKFTPRILLRHAGPLAGIQQNVEGRLICRVAGYQIQKPFSIRPQTSDTLQIELNLQDVQLWSPENPHLYPLRFDLLTDTGDTLDTIQFPFGFRQLQTQNDQLQLNGQVVSLSALDYRLVSAGDLPLSPSEIREDLTRIRDLGFNTITMRGTPATRELLTQADWIGLLVFDTVPLIDLPAPFLGLSELIQEARHYTRALLRRSVYHPSCAGINLLDGAVLGSHGTSQMLAELLPLIPGTLLSTLSMTAVVDGVTTFPDLIWIEDWNDRIAETLTRNPPPCVLGLVLLHNQAESGNLSGYLNPRSQAHQALRLKEFLDSAPFSDHVHFRAGSYTDWKTAQPLFWRGNTKLSHLHTDGLYTLEREEKLVARMAHARLTFTEEPPLNQGSWIPPVSPWLMLIPLVALLFLAISVKQNNVFSQNLKRSLIQVQGFYHDIHTRRVFQFGQGLLVSLLTSVSVGSLLATTFTHYRESLFFDEVISLIITSQGLKSVLIQLAWDPLYFVLSASVLIFLLQVFIGLFLLAAGRMFRESAGHQIFHYLFWSGSPLLMLLPLDIVLPRLLMLSWGPATGYILVILILIWQSTRAFGFMRQLFPGSTIRILLLITLILLLLISLFLWNDQNYLTLWNRFRFLLMKYS